MIIEKSLLYLDTALEDCFAADKLYKSKLYPHAIFFLNQSVEKVCKYYAIRNELLNPDEVKNNLGHNSLKLFTKILKNHFLSLENEWIKNSDKSSYNFKPFFKQIQTEFDAFGNLKSWDLINLKENELDNLLFRLDSLDKTEKLPTPLDYIFNDSETLVKGLINMGIIQETDIQNLEESKLKKLLFELNKLLKYIPDYQKNIAKLILIATIFSNNLNMTRYPDLELMKTPSQIFTKDNVLVSHLPRISKHIHTIIKTLKMFNEIKI